MGSDYCGTRVILIPSVTYTAGFLYSPFSVKRESVSHSIQLFLTSQTVAHQAPLSMEFSRQEYWSGYSLFQGGIKPVCPALQLDSLLSEPPGEPFNAPITYCHLYLVGHFKNPFLVKLQVPEEQMLYLLCHSCVCSTWNGISR